MNTNIKEKGAGEEIDFQYTLEKFADLQILRYRVSGFSELKLNQKLLIYYLSQAAVCGRDILFDQNGKYSLLIRRIIEHIYLNYTGSKDTKDWQNFVVYLKRVWFSNGIYHHYSSDKIQPEFSEDYFKELIHKTNKQGFPSLPGKTMEESLELIVPVIFNPSILSKKVEQNSELDIVRSSAVNFYEDITQSEVEAFYDKQTSKDDSQPVSYGLNSKLCKKGGQITEKVCKIGGLYTEAIDEIIFWLEKATEVTENPAQKVCIEKLITYYQSGDLKTWDEYNILWLKDLNSDIDFINGFVETYNDPLGLKGSWESLVNYKDVESSKRTEMISDNAQWFEDNSPVQPQFKKDKVKGVTAKVIKVAMLGGDCYPYTPIGINLPNSDWIRKEYGSKSVTIENVTEAYYQANLSSGFLEEFAYDKEEIEQEKQFGLIANNLHVDLHECLGHGSGQLLPGVQADALKNYSAVIEEARADLFALYYVIDPKLQELGILQNEAAAYSLYSSYIRNGLMTQLTRVVLGKDIEEAHMRNRQLIAAWCFERGMADGVICKEQKEGKTYFRVMDFMAMRKLIAELLVEVQRIKSEGDFEAARVLVETYGVKVDQDLHKEVLHRFEKLNIAPYNGFVNPFYELLKVGKTVVDVQVSYLEGFVDQMLRYSKDFSFLPNIN